jgi:hypothetical protein
VPSSPARHAHAEQGLGGGYDQLRERRGEVLRRFLDRPVERQCDLVRPGGASVGHSLEPIRGFNDDSFARSTRRIRSTRKGVDHPRRHEGEAGCPAARQDSLNQLAAGFEGEASDIEIQAREVLALARRLEEIIAEPTGQPVAKVASGTERD